MVIAMRVFVPASLLRSLTEEELDVFQEQLMHLKPARVDPSELPTDDLPSRSVDLATTAWRALSNLRV